MFKPDIQTEAPDASTDSPDGESFLRPAESLGLSEAERSSRPFAQYDLMPWEFEGEREMADFTVGLLRGFSAIRDGEAHLPQAIYVLWNRRSGEYLVRDGASKPTFVGQEVYQSKRGFAEYAARLDWDKQSGTTVESFEVDPRWQRTVDRQTDA